VGAGQPLEQGLVLDLEGGPALGLAAAGDARVREAQMQERDVDRAPDPARVFDRRAAGFFDAGFFAFDRRVARGGGASLSSSSASSSCLASSSIDKKVTASPALSKWRLSRHGSAAARR